MSTILYICWKRCLNSFFFFFYFHCLRSLPNDSRDHLTERDSNNCDLAEGICTMYAVIFEVLRSIRACKAMAEPLINQNRWQQVLMAEVRIGKQTRWKLGQQRAFSVSTSAGLICSKCTMICLWIVQPQQGCTVKKILTFIQFPDTTIH